MQRITCPVCGRIPHDRRPVWVVDFIVEDEANDDESRFTDFLSAQEEAERIGSQVQLGLSDDCRTPNLALVPFAP